MVLSLVIYFSMSPDSFLLLLLRTISSTIIIIIVLNIIFLKRTLLHGLLICLPVTIFILLLLLRGTVGIFLGSLCRSRLLWRLVD